MSIKIINRVLEPGVESNNTTLWIYSRRWGFLQMNVLNMHPVRVSYGSVVAVADIVVNDVLAQGIGSSDACESTRSTHEV